jgi:hypothetical protein
MKRIKTKGKEGEKKCQPKKIAVGAEEVRMVIV